MRQIQIPVPPGSVGKGWVILTSKFQTSVSLQYVGIGDFYMDRNQIIKPNDPSEP